MFILILPISVTPYFKEHILGVDLGFVLFSIKPKLDTCNEFYSERLIGDLLCEND